MASKARAKGRRYSLLLAMAILSASANHGCGPPAEPDSRGEGAATPEATVRVSLDERLVVLFLGTSLTAGYGLTAEEAFPALIQQRIDAEHLPFRVVNAGVSGDTSAGGLRRLDWLLRQPIKVLVLELGANDMLRGQGAEAMGKNLQAIVDRTRVAHPEVELVVAGMRAAPNLGATYADAFESSFARLAERNEGTLIPFLLEGVAADPELNQPDGIHPTAEGHRRVADTVWTTLRPLLTR